MSPFEYVVVLISIILGLGITTILTGIAEWIKHYRSSRLYAPYIIWIVLVFVLHIHEWWESYLLKSIEVWPLPLFLFVILYPINLYVLAHLLFPRHTDENVFDAKKYYFGNYPKFFISALVLDTISIIHNLSVLKLPFESQIVQFLVLGILGSTLLSKTKKESVHVAIALFLLLLMIVSLFFTTDTLLIGD